MTARSNPSDDRDDRIVVLRVIDRLNVGGPAIHAVLTARGLDAKRFRTVLVIGSVEPGEANMGYLLDEHRVECEVIPSLGRELRPLRDLVTAWKLYRVIRRHRPHVVHTHKAKAGALGRAMALLARVPVRVHTFHGHVFHGYFGSMKTQLFLGIERLLARWTTRLVALSDRLVDELANRYRIASADRFTVVPLGFDLAPFERCERHRGALRAKLGVSPDTKLIAIVGRMVPVKDHATFVAAFGDLASRRREIACVFVGGGELEAEVRAEIARRGLTERAHFLGWQRNLDEIYPDLDAVVLSSVNEGTPVALIEAMSCGIPVAATSVGGVADVLHQGQRGELAPSGDPAALAQAIDRALAPDALARAARIRGQVISEYGGHRLCRDLEGLYERLLADSGCILGRHGR